MLEILGRPGLWKRAGMSGVLSGLDLVEAMASLPDQCDAGLARVLFVIAERGYVAAALATMPKGKT